MSSAIEIQCFTILSAANSAQIGLILHTNNPTKARTALYKARRDLGDTALASLHIRVSPVDPEHDLWLLRRQAAPALDTAKLLED